MPKKPKPLKGKLTVKDLAKASADYNPRTITDKRLRALKTSYETYGDLSGIVLNRRTGTLVSGHQRIKTLSGKKTRVVSKPHKDLYGTIAIGFVEILEDGHLTRIPYREVSWSDQKAEKAANIAANAHGGEFDPNKLAKLVEEIEPTEEFEIEALGLDPVTLKQLSYIAAKGTDGKESSGKSKGKDKGSDSGFTELDGESFEFQHQCPRCKFKF